MKKIFAEIFGAILNIILIGLVSFLISNNVSSYYKANFIDPLWRMAEGQSRVNQAIIEAIAKLRTKDEDLSKAINSLTESLKTSNNSNTTIINNIQGFQKTQKYGSSLTKQD